MCSAWIKQQYYPELSAQQLEKISSDRLLRNSIEIINLTGGEPTLREDMVDIIKIIKDNFRSLRRIDIPTNGIDTGQVIDKIERTLAVILPTGVKLNITVSLDGLAETHEKVRGVKGAFSKVELTIKELKELSSLYPSLSININATVGRDNVKELRHLFSYARSCGMGINFTLAAISEIGAESSALRDKFEVPQENKKALITALEALINDKAINQAYGSFVINWLRTGKRNAPCNFRKGNVFLLEPDGEAYLCGNFKEFRLGNLLNEPFEGLWRDAPKILNRVSDKCSTCVSNCYLGW